MEIERSLLMSKILVMIDGGIVQGTTILKTPLLPGKVDGVIIIDWDTQGSEDDELTKASDPSGHVVEALVHEETFESADLDSDATLMALSYIEPVIVTRAKEKDLPLLVSQLKTEAGKEALTERLKS
jgi:hypothetical protein